MKQIVESAILGAAIGDALGVPFEFKSRDEMALQPATTMIGRGTHNQPIGTWSDDTSMIIASLDALATKLDYEEIMRNFLLWYDDGKYTPRGLVFDIGRTTEYALRRFKIAKLPAVECGDSMETANGNGSLMRIIPFVLYCWIRMSKKKLDDETAEIIHNGSSLTHAHNRSKIACGIYASIIFELLKKRNKRAITKGIKKAYKFYSKQYEFVDELKLFNRVFDSKFSNTPIDDIKSSGYVLDSLEASIWCALNTDSYKESVLAAVNLGGDTDTIASITGGITGLLYGIGSIPSEWMKELIGLDYIKSICATV